MSENDSDFILDQGQTTKNEILQEKNQKLTEMNMNLVTSLGKMQYNYSTLLLKYEELVDEKLKQER